MACYNIRGNRLLHYWLSPQRESSYKSKDYNPALFAIDKILETKNDLGEALSLRGLLLSLLGRNSEALEFASRGTESNNQSIFCWITYGLIYHSDFDYEKAKECFQKAIYLSMNLLDLPKNIQLLRYLSVIQAQMRNLPEFVESRARILTLQPENDLKDPHLHHIASATSHHLNADYSKAIEVLKEYGKSLVDGDYSKHDEVLLYELFLLEESGDLAEALALLHDKESIIVNDVALKERKASLLVKLNNLDAANEIYRELLLLDPENSSYHSGLQKCVVSSENGQYSSADVQVLKDLYKSLEEQHSSSVSVKRIPLDFLQGDELENATAVYLRHLLDERVPLLLYDLSPFYERQYPDKIDIIGQVILELESSIRKKSEPIRALLWTLCLLAQHYDRHGQYAIALAKAIQQNPEVAQFYFVKKIQHAGALDGGGEQQDSSRDMWYELASGHSYFQQGDLGHALKNYLAVVNYYVEKVEHYFDYHFDQSRKVAPHTYVDTLRHQERLDPGSYFHKATEGVVRCYLKLHDKTLELLPVEKMMQGASTSRVPDSGKMQDNNLPRKKPQKSHAKDMSGKNGKKTRASTSGGQQHSKLIDTDLLAVKLLQVEKLLLEAARYLNLLQKSFPDSFGTYFLLFELHMRNQDIVDAYHALNELVRFDESNPDTLRCSVRFYGRLDSMVLEESVRSNLSDPLSTLHEGTLIKSIKESLERNKDSLSYGVAVAEMLFFLQPYKKSEIAKLLNQRIKFARDNKNLWKLKDCIAVHRLLKSVLGDAETASEFAKECSQLFPFSRYFLATKPTNDTPVKNEEPEVWVFDSGGGHHYTTNVKLLVKNTKYRKPGTLNVSSGNEVSYKDVGLVHIECGISGNFFLKDVPDYSAHRKIVSIPRFTEDNPYAVQLFHDGFLLRDKSFIGQVPPEYVLVTGQITNKGYMFMSDWKLDSGTNDHCTSNELLLDSSADGCVGIVATSADGSKRTVSKVGSRELFFTSEKGISRTFMLKKVYVFAVKSRSVISVSAFAKDNQCSFLFTSNEYYILDAKVHRFLKPELMRGYGIERKGLYYSS
ncbi:N-terminal acetyltransferase A complex auxiliary subunit NAA15-like isoform X1 [Papaver somniferum]|uniref:N-terminal acetyltransferase A complex auxiliary subunit NAA15-like isoform X1 n=1 Tax=Papaver somniferum TaxID=3469 RepID=UPI000E704D14|nr:N-terminal acetyltransferase A complex auxiliary subunit NAA15-like isoform X1 [Papaver somniferum]XP_026430231.1 N-terminal acetyltransferase A complex auxiliary subunit NAA15-like isoform X1 [Papaver somniferum]XP_026430232.1 N-terminal acetyltransferase A complex auxiliary subunit NAA15-like isoform X1 [Papaver somniferum]XP_026430233.1 N-terminal acetyltransferase A complex auxiliary subunit NAA15-like isoform X1 [Papaver somniferum]XP_026430234.1 N-terminal acetyltransferase A complex a